MKKIKYLGLYKFKYQLLYYLFDLPKDIIHYLKKEKPYWSDAICCGKLFCRYCGGKITSNH